MFLLTIFSYGIKTIPEYVVVIKQRNCISIVCEKRTPDTKPLHSLIITLKYSQHITNFYK